MKTDKEKEDFRRHLRRYAQIYLPDCPFEVNSTNRYTIVTQEAAITARRYIRRNESVKYLSGIQVVITPDEEKEISTRKKDFSIVVSSRNKCTSLFMGPARFANHDCDANAKLVTTSHAGIEIIATKNIDVGDEITVTYGENYFGEDNCECLCQACETALRNGWEPEDGATPVEISIEEAKSESYSLRRRKMRDDSVGDSSRNSSATPVLRPKIPKTRASSSRLNPSRSSPAVDSPTPDITPSGRKRPIDALATPPFTPAKRMKHLIPTVRAMSRGSSSSRSESSSRGDAADTDVTSPDKESPPPQMPTPSKELRSSKKPVDLTPMALETILNTPTEECPPALPAVTASVETIDVIDLTSNEEEELEEELEEEAEEATEKAPKPRKKYERRVFIKETTPEARLRTPGDYTLTPLLLAEPTMAWIQCGNCPTYFVQKDSYFTRSSCPRCERHSMIYGYIWPKTDKAGHKDREERVLDHRTIHRFLDSHDERRARGYKGICEESEEPEEPERGRPKKRGRPAKKHTKPAKKTKKKIMEEEEEYEEEEPEEDTTGLRRSGRPRRISSRLILV